MYRRTSPRHDPLAEDEDPFAASPPLEAILEEEPIGPVSRQPVRIEASLTIYYPPPSSLSCSELSCSWQCSAVAWTSRKQGLLRHLEGTHRIKPTETLLICAGCEELLGKRPGTHRCEAGQVQDTHVNHLHQCPEDNCNSSFPSPKGLQNHIQWHRRKEALTRMNNASITGPPTTTPPAQATTAQANNPSRPTVNFDLSLPSTQNSVPSTTSTQNSAVSTQNSESATPSLNSQIANIEYPPLPIRSQTEYPQPSDTPLQYDESFNESFRDAEEELNLSTVSLINQSNHVSSLTVSHTETGEPSTSTTTIENGTNEENPHNHDLLNSQAPLGSSHTPVIPTGPSNGDSSQESTDIESDDGNNPQQHDDLLADVAINDNQTEQPEEEPPPSNYLLDEYLAPLNEQCRETNWDDFEALLENITAKIQQHFRIQTAPAQQSEPRPIDIDNCRDIQRIYRQNRRRAVRLILDGQNTRCNISNPDVEAHFDQLYQEKAYDESALYDLPTAPDDRTPAEMTPFTEADIKTRLRKAENTSPGSDKLTYNHWREADPDCQALQLIFQVCIKNKRIPLAWKKSRTILIPKPGDLDHEDIGNWRPIALCRTIYKLYASCLVQRLRLWATTQEVFSTEQKGFMPHDGVVEHNYALQHYMNDARLHQGEICVTQLDLQSAFNGIQINLIRDSLAKLGVGEEMLQVLNDIMTDTTTSVLTTNGPTRDLDVKCGVRQGCPLSGFLFNAGIEPLIRTIKRRAQEVSPTDTHHCLAYADDLTIITKNNEAMQTVVDSTVEACDALELVINPRKTTYMHWSGQQPRGPRNTSITIKETTVTALEEFQTTKFLGKPIGFNAIASDTRIDDAIEKAKKILNSKLAPWQRLDALRSFILPSLIFPMRTWQHNKTAYEKFDTQIRPLIKKTLYLPARSSNEYLYGSAARGACGLPIAAEDSDIFLVDTAFKLLTSNDPTIHQLANTECKDIAKARLGGLPNVIPADAIDQFLTNPTLPRRASTVQCVWTKARSASIRLGCEWTTTRNTASITHGGKTLKADKRREVAATIRNNLKLQRDAALLRKPDQGKTFHMIQADKASSHFMKEGKYTAFADWRFIHRARLNLLPLNACKRGQNVNKRCRRCGRYDETLPHVINHCARHYVTMTKRHDDIVKRLKDTAQFLNWRVVSENQQVPESGITSRPDLVISKGDEAIIVDVACPFENGENAFETARDEKKTKYEDVARFLRGQYRKVTIEPFIVGSTGAYDPRNSTLTKRIATRAYTKVLKLLCVSSTIRWSRMQYIEHITGTRQY